MEKGYKIKKIVKKFPSIAKSASGKIKNAMGNVAGKIPVVKGLQKGYKAANMIRKTGISPEKAFESLRTKKLSTSDGYMPKK